MNTTPPDSHISIVSFHNDSLERIAAMPSKLADILYRFLSSEDVSIGGKIFNKTSHNTEQIEAVFSNHIHVEKALSEIKTYQDTLDKESKGIPRSKRIQGNVRYYLGKILANNPLE